MNEMSRTVMFIGMGYLSGSVLYARVFARVFRKENMLEQSRDHNPGTANAFLYGGFWCGVCTLIFDLLKGFLPVYVFLQNRNPDAFQSWLSALVLAAPVIGHTFSVFYGFRGGKGIAVTFGCLAGLYPVLEPLYMFAFCFIFFSTILKISPHFYRTVFSYLLALLMIGRKAEGMLFIVRGFFAAAVVVLIRMLTSKEKKSRLEMKLFGCFNTFLRDRRRT